MIIRFLVRWHAEAHIRSKLLAISRNRRLLIERLNVSSDEDSDSIKLFVYLENLERYAQDLIHWGRIKSTILKVIGFLTIAIPILTLFIPQLRPFEGISDPKFLGTMIVELLRIDKSKAFEVILGLNILYAIAVVLYFAFIECGFNVKRAVFAGGLVSEKSDGRDKIKMTFLKRIPYHNVYHIENKVFDLLGVTKPKEFPIDLVINLYVILCLWGLALFSYLSQWGLNSRNDLLVFFVALVVVGIFALLNFFIHRSLRMEKGDM